MAQVVVGSMNINKAIALFKKQCESEGILKEVRKREFAMTKSQKRHVKSIAARTALAKNNKKNKYKAGE